MECAVAKPSRKVWKLRRLGIERLRGSSEAPHELTFLRAVFRWPRNFLSFETVWLLSWPRFWPGRLLFLQVPNQETRQDHGGNDHKCSNDCDSRFLVHFLPSQGTIAPQLFTGQRKPLKLPSRVLVLISFRSAQNWKPHLGQVR